MLDHILLQKWIYFCRTIYRCRDSKQAESPRVSQIYIGCYLPVGAGKDGSVSGGWTAVQGQLVLRRIQHGGVQFMGDLPPHDENLAVRSFEKIAFAHALGRSDDSVLHQITEKEQSMTIEKDLHFADPGEPFTFLNLFEMDKADVDQFVVDWKRRSAIMGQQLGFISANLLKSVLPNSRYQLVNVSFWQSYEAWVAANNDPTYADQLAANLDHTKSIQVTRGFYRPVAAYTHLYE